MTTTTTERETTMSASSDHRYDPSEDRCTCGCEEVWFDYHGYGCAENGLWADRLRRYAGPTARGLVRRLADDGITVDEFLDDVYGPA